jgi:transposase
LVARRYGVSENTLYRWRDQFLEGGKAGLADGRRKKDPNGRAIEALRKEIEDRDRVIGELTIANRVLKKISGDHH